MTVRRRQKTLRRGENSHPGRTPASRKRETRGRMPTAPYHSGEFEAYRDARVKRLPTPQEVESVDAELEWVDLGAMFADED